ncbi:MAG: threonine aldolase [Chitinophagaceae bacterium]|nr:MAG: threonine aldolase [Chitinophagaceae bacterium]
MIDLRSDTVTQPGKGMLQAMLTAKTGDDVFREDPTVNELEEYCADMFGKEAGLFVPSGTMSNQIALKVLTRPMDEIICDELSHIYNYENGGYAYHSGLSIKLIKGENGLFKAEDLKNAIQPKADWLPESRLVCIENTSNKGGGGCYKIEEIKKIKNFCLDNQLYLHMDGARIWNAIVAKKVSPAEYGKYPDTISICFSKGLGAPVGSMLLGTEEHIQRARKIRKAMGGGMRQAGILAAGAMFAIRHQTDRLEEDHQHAKTLERSLENCSYIKSILPVETNIVIARLIESVDIDNFINNLSNNGIFVSKFGSDSFRMVTHLNIDSEMIENVCKFFNKLKN